jgi:hypothetical protein
MSTTRTSSRARNRRGSVRGGLREFFRRGDRVPYFEGEQHRPANEEDR